MTKFVVWIVLFFGVYSGYKFLPVFFAKGRVERAIETVLDDTRHDAAEGAIRHMIARRAVVYGDEIDKESIQVDRETREGERIFHVAINYPTTVSYLGSERTVTSEIRTTRVMRVDEAKLARAAETKRKRDEEEEDWRREMQGAWDECEEKHGQGNCTYSEIPGAGRKIVKDF